MKSMGMPVALIPFAGVVESSWTKSHSRYPYSRHRVSVCALDAIHDMALSDEDQEEIRRRLGD